MFYRVIQASLEPDKVDELVEIIGARRSEYLAMDGVSSGTLVQTGLGDVVMIAVYESEEAYNAISDRVNTILAEVVSVLKGPPTIASGKSIWDART